MRLRRTSDDPKDPRCCLAIEDEFPGEDGDIPSGLITITEENLTSNAITARTSSVRSAIDLTTEQAQWLYFALGRILLGRGGIDPNGIHGLTDEQANARLARAPEGDGRTLSDVIRDSKIGGGPVSPRAKEKA